MKNALFGGALSLTVGTLIVKLLGLIYKIPIASILGELGMGYFNTAYTLFSVFYLLATAGVPKAIMIVVAEITGDEQARRSMIARTVRIALAFFIPLGFIFSLLLLLLAGPLSSLIGNRGAALTVAVIAPSIVAVAAAGVLRGLLSAEQRLGAIAVSQIIEGSFKLAAGLILGGIASSHALPKELVSAFAVAGVTLGSFSGLIYLYLIAKNSIWADKTRQDCIVSIDKPSILKKVFSISVPVTLSAAVMSITNLIDLSQIMRGLISSGINGNTATAMYGNYTTGALSIFNLAIALITPISIAHIPLITEARAKGLSPIEKVRSSIYVSAMLSVPIALGAYLYSEEIIRLLFPGLDPVLGGSLLRSVTPEIILMSAIINVNSSLEALGRQRVPVISMLAASAVKLISGAVLLEKTELGILSAPISTVLSYVTALIISTSALTKALGKSPKITAGHIKPFLITTLSALPVKVLYNRMTEGVGEAVALLISVGITVLIYAFLNYLSGSFKEIRAGMMSKSTNFA